MGERTEHPAQRVAELAVRLDRVLENFLPDAQVVGIIGRAYPEPQHVGARLLDHVLWGRRIAKRLRHLTSCFVEHEAVGQNDVKGGRSTRDAAPPEGGLERDAVRV